MSMFDDETLLLAREVLDGDPHVPVPRYSAQDLANAILSAHEADRWLPMVDAPLDGTEIAILMRHPQYWTALKLDGKEKADAQWQQIVRAKWIDHNAGGWTWHGIAGSPVGWRPLPPAPKEAK